MRTNQIWFTKAKNHGIIMMWRDWRWWKPGFKMNYLDCLDEQLKPLNFSRTEAEGKTFWQRGTLWFTTYDANSCQLTCSDNSLERKVFSSKRRIHSTAASEIVGNLKKFLVEKKIISYSDKDRLLMDLDDYPWQLLGTIRDNAYDNGNDAEAQGWEWLLEHKRWPASRSDMLFGWSYGCGGADYPHGYPQRILQIPEKKIILSSAAHFLPMIFQKRQSRGSGGGNGGTEFLTAGMKTVYHKTVREAFVTAAVAIGNFVSKK